MRRLALLVVPFLFAVACSAPPQKELDLAQGAIDAARAAGAQEYATREFEQATSALQQAHDAVAQRDHRLALTRALDAHDRAQSAAKAAADGKARARSEADVAIATAAAAVQPLRARIAAAESGKAPRRAISAAARVQSDVEAVLQKARAAVAAGDFLSARESVKEIPGRITAAIATLDAAAVKKPTRPARRSRR